MKIEISRQVSEAVVSAFGELKKDIIKEIQGNNKQNVLKRKTVEKQVSVNKKPKHDYLSESSSEGEIYDDTDPEEDHFDSNLEDSEDSESDMDMTVSQDPKGPKIHDKLAKQIDHNLTRTINHPKLKELIEKYPPPINSNEFRVPKTNKFIFEKMPDYLQKRDKDVQTVQMQLIANLTAASQLKTLFKDSKKNNTKLDTKKCNELTTDLIKTNIASLNSLKNYRRNMIKTSVTKNLKSLCTRPDEGSSQEFLFSDTTSRIEEVTKQHKLLKQMNLVNQSKHKDYQDRKTKNLQKSRSRPNFGSQYQKWGHQEEKKSFPYREYKSNHTKRGGKHYPKKM